jgi:N,N-dimethylformamidase
VLIGYVSDERDMALADVSVEICRGETLVTVTHSTASGAIHAEVEPGEHRITLARKGYGPKRETAWIDSSAPRRFRLLSDSLLGYAWPKWVRAGERTELRVHAVEPFRAELWRYGLHKKHVRLLGWFDEHGSRAMAQLLPDGDFTQTGVNWNGRGYIRPHQVCSVEAPERSGLYYFHVNTESDGFFSFPWIVAPSTPTAPIAVLASTNTWNAYNRFGGRSNYISAEGLPPTPTVNARLELLRYRATEDPWIYPSAANEAYPPLSFERPEPDCHVDPDVKVTDPMAGRIASLLAPGLWRLLAWLERENCTYDLYSDYQLHVGELDLDSYQVLVLDMHPEYWSQAMYNRVKSWVHGRGGHLVYLGGNGIDCEVEVLGPDSARYLTQQPDPRRAEEAHLESRFHRTVESQTHLLGVAFTPAGQNTAAPYEVCQSDHWVFAGTGLHDGDTFGAETLHERVPGGASGHETDKRTPSSPDDIVVLARGLNPNKGGAEMIYRKLPPPGGGVFSAGSITFAAGLLTDDCVSRITTNVLTRFGGYRQHSRAEG